MAGRECAGRSRARHRSLAFDGLEVHSLGLAALVLFEVVADLLVLRQRAHSGALNGSDVDERVLSAVFRRDEAVALGVVEKFDCADGHVVIPSNRGGPPIGPPALGEAKRRSEEPQSALKSVRLRLVASAT